jgi:branched-chain amino acid transport system substrate-binding protein
MRGLPAVTVPVIAALLVGCGSHVPTEELRRTLEMPQADHRPFLARPNPDAGTHSLGPASGTTVATAAKSRSRSSGHETSESTGPEHLPTAPTQPGAAGGPARPIGAAPETDLGHQGSGPTPLADDPPKSGSPPVVIGSVGTLSGPVGAAMQGGPMAVRVWAKAVNSRGGLGGRPV